ncbi:MAG: hypothetical protein ACI4TL_03910, partial [Candidatus Cryptobacteroides sp.]
MKKILLISMIILCAGVYSPAQDFNMQEEEYYLDELPPASVSGKRKKKVKKYGKEWREKYRLVY